jgi:hypothetical protein
MSDEKDPPHRHGCICQDCAEERWEPKPERIDGILFYPTGAGQDTVRCQCGWVCDVGGELQAHLREHKQAEMDEWLERY